MTGMAPSAPPATGLRIPWEHLPEPVRDAVAGVLGAPVVHAVTQPGGFSPGVAARVRTAEGRRAFVKAVSVDTNPHAPHLHRTEARNAAALPPAVPAPRLLGTHDDGTWVALVYQDVTGRQPHVPWREPELRRVLDAVGQLARALTPTPLDAPPAATALGHTFDGWRQLLEGQEAGELPPANLGTWTATNLPRLAEPPPQLVLAADVRARQNKRSAVPPAPRLDQPLVLEHLQDLAQRHPADPEPLRQLPLRRQPLPARYQAQPDDLEDLLQRLLEAVAGPHRSQHRRQPVVRAAVSVQRHMAVPPSQAMVLRNTLWLPADRRSRRRLSRGRPHTPAERRGAARPRRRR
ncbi:hypothetical protein SALBM311S_12776 [Streptomyces alboniger]